MIFGKHEIGWGDKVTVEPGEIEMLGTSVMKIRMPGWDESGSPAQPVESYLDRADVERLRDLCDEALA